MNAGDRPLQNIAIFRTPLDQADPAENAAERSPELMRHGGQKLILCAIRVLGGLAGGLQFCFTHEAFADIVDDGYGSNDDAFLQKRRDMGTLLHVIDLELL